MHTTCNIERLTFEYVFVLSIHFYLLLYCNKSYGLLDKIYHRYLYQSMKF